MKYPVATYRVQLNKDFPFSKAEALIPYLVKLGISDLYASPVFAARPGSTHGYDVVDLGELPKVDTASLRVRGLDAAPGPGLYGLPWPRGARRWLWPVYACGGHFSSTVAVASCFTPSRSMKWVSFALPALNSFSA